MDGPLGAAVGARRYLLGFGNYARGDDGIGLHLVEYICAHGMNRGFEALELRNDGLQLLNYLVPQTERILVADCALMEERPGTHRLFRPEDVDSRKLAGGISTHEGDLLTLLEMGRRLGLPVPDLWILAVQPQSLHDSMELSDVLRHRLPDYADAAIQVLTDPDGVRSPEKQPG